MDYKKGKFESTKFDYKKDDYAKYLEYLNRLNLSAEEIIHQFPAYVGSMTIQRYLTLYDLYKKTLGIAGHLAEVGVYKGSGTIFLSKLVEIFEPNSLTQVHGFDWFKGDDPDPNEEKHLIKGAYSHSYEELLKLIDAQKLNHVIRIHKIDIINELEPFFNDNPTLKFKFVFLDSGTYKVTFKALQQFLSKIVKGGIIVFDQYNFELAPGETKAVDELLGSENIKTLPYAWMPNAYYIKE